jgi:hypothetical protein
VVSPEIDNTLEQLAKANSLLYEKRGHILRVYQPLDKAEFIHVQIFSILSMVRVGADKINSVAEIRHDYKFPLGYFERRRTEAAELSRRRREEMVLPWLGRVVRLIGLLYLLFAPTGLLGTVGFEFAAAAVILPSLRG